MEQATAEEFKKLLEIITKLRSPEGCLWDRCQKKSDVGRYLIEEAYEVLDAIASGVSEELKEELGDLFFQILFIARIAEEGGEFDIAQVINGISKKMIRRHPHVFGGCEVRDVEEIKRNWEDIKLRLELKESKNTSCLAGVPLSMPALLKAQKITEKAAKVGFDWENIEGVLIKVEEELSELREALASKEQKKISEELGDVLFALVNLGRFAGINAEDALRISIEKFMKRFSFIEDRLKERGSTPAEASLQEMDTLWNEAKEIKE
jgi:tetrapyrrole methylase family protein/MazG family protein